MVLCLWSGGCDSTLLLHGAVTAGGHIKAISIVHPQVINSGSTAAVTARRKIKAKMNKDGLYFAHTTVTVDHEDPFEVQGFEHGLTQPLLWLNLAINYLGQDEDLQIAYIRGDDIWHYRQQLLYAFDNLQYIGGRTGKLLFPLEWLPKTEVIKKLKEFGLYDLCWFCELSKTNKPCEDCAACLTHRTALWRIDQERQAEPADGDKDHKQARPHRFRKLKIRRHKR